MKSTKDLKMDKNLKHVNKLYSLSAKYCTNASNQSLYGIRLVFIWVKNKHEMKQNNKIVTVMFCGMKI